jgi:uncharacterized protein YbjT (DUF2867 family)
MNQYLVEQYLPGVTASQLDDASARLAAAASELAANGVDVRYISSTFIPEEESCFCRFEAHDARDVRRACERAGVALARVVETHDFSPKTEEQ